jgi:hypothetical protein
MTRSWRRALRHQVTRQCGDPGEHLARYGHTLGDWVDAGSGPIRPALREVDAEVAGYLGVAARTGRRWGSATGLVLGGAAAALAFVVVWLVA